MNRLSRLLRPALLVAVLTLLMGAVVQAAGSATIRDDAGLFTPKGRSAIERAADQNDVRVVVITNRQRFPSRSAWRSCSCPTFARRSSPRCRPHRRPWDR